MSHTPSKLTRPAVDTSSSWTVILSNSVSVSAASSGSPTSSSTATRSASTPLTRGTIIPASGDTPSSQASSRLLSSFLFSKTKLGEGSDSDHSPKSSRPAAVHPNFPHRTSSHNVPQFNVHGNILEPLCREYTPPKGKIDVAQRLALPALPRTHSYELNKSTVGRSRETKQCRGLMTVEEKQLEERKEKAERERLEKDRKRADFERVKAKLKAFCLK